MQILITGSAGFLGHHFVEEILKKTDHTITILDKLTYASSGFDRLKDIGAYENPRVKIFTIDLSLPSIGSLRTEIGNPDWIVHLAAETHVDRSIHDPWPFVVANFIGTFQMLEFAKSVQGLKKFLYFSTDEVFGDAPNGISYKEWDRYNSRNPYAATKAGAEELCLAYANSYNIPMVITHAHNIYGERQHKEKFIPIVINKLKKEEILEIHCKDGKPASRAWIHARNASNAILFLLENTPVNVRDKFNITGEIEMNNLDLALLIAEMMGKELKYNLGDYYSNRPGHDPSYRLDGSKIKEMGWSMPVDFEASLEKTITWSLLHPRWLDWR
jgi:dTDP-glucose 4,6-dehydratase